MLNRCCYLVAALATTAAVADTFVPMTSDAVVKSGARYATVAPSYTEPLSPTVAPLKVVAFDFQGMTFSTTVSNTSSVDVVLYWHHWKPNYSSNMPHRLRIECTPMSNKDSNDHKNGAATATFGSVVWWLDTSAQSAGSTAPLRYAGCEQLDPTLQYTVALFHATEPNWNQLFSHPNAVEAVGFILSASPDAATSLSGSVVGASAGARRGAPVAAAPPVRGTGRRVEFLGDSITCGFCNLCRNPPFPNATGYALESYYDSWAHLTCARLGADCHTVAWSGYGMVENCCGGNTTLPMVYNRTLGSDSGSVWNFAAQTEPTPAGQSAWAAPQAVVVNLGTNDFFDRHKMPHLAEAYKREYLALLNFIDSNYGQRPYYFLACGPMSELYCDEVFAVINATATTFVDPAHGNAPRVHFLDQRGLVTPANLCCGHPDANADVTLADRTTATLQAVVPAFAP